MEGVAKEPAFSAQPLDGTARLADGGKVVQSSHPGRRPERRQAAGVAAGTLPSPVSLTRIHTETVLEACHCAKSVNV